MLRLRPPWWFCCGLWSPWCVLDTIAHGLRLHHMLRLICDKHDAAITGWDMTPEEFDARAAAGEPVDLVVSPNLRVTSALGFRVREAPRTWSTGGTLHLDHSD